MAELGVGYISIIPETSKITPGIAKALGSAEPAADKSGKSMGGKLASGMGTALKGAALGVGVAAGAAVATGLTKGMGRLTGIENAEAKGGNAILAFRFDTSELGTTWTEICAYGTAVRVRKL